MHKTYIHTQTQAHTNAPTISLTEKRRGERCIHKSEKENAVWLASPSAEAATAALNSVF